MKATRLSRVLAVAGLAVWAAACSEANAPSAVTDSMLAADLAASSGEAIARDVIEVMTNEVTAGLPAPGLEASAPASVSDTSNLSVSRSRTCYNAQGSVVTCGPNAASVKTTFTLDGTVSRDYFSAVVHRTRADSVYGDSSTLAKSDRRTHNGTGTSRDTTTFVRDSTTRRAAESSVDSIVNLVFQLPRDRNPWPVSGTIIRNLNATITITGKVNETRTISRRVVVTFPADAQGNVSIQVGTLRCTLNLVTHKVSNCSGS